MLIFFIRKYTDSDLIRSSVSLILVTGGSHKNWFFPTSEKNMANMENPDTGNDP